MERAETSQRVPDEESSFLIPRGPIFVPDLVSPLTKVSVFESDVYHELESLKGELGSELIDFCEEDISVDGLKIYSNEELVLVSEAMKIAFEGDQGAGTSDLAENRCSSGAEDDHIRSDIDTSASCESSDGFSSETSQYGIENDVNLLKRKGRAKAKSNSKNSKTKKLIACEKDKQIDVLFSFYYLSAQHCMLLTFSFSLSLHPLLSLVGSMGGLSI